MIARYRLSINEIKNQDAKRHALQATNKECRSAPYSTRRSTWAAPDGLLNYARSHRFRFDPYLHVLEDEGGAA
jgi:hypothetical protein